ncbi:supervillin isoform X3 [Tribolium castaneum]|uniref:supervillin isoform X3 n=1 Tax=Tribolium castaneum TaxID=7070 RepID=UPI00077DCC01|nr:PREDICTED: supervillin isoform X3 [Tribolium castaneum]|eukprot:XP_015840336.1 PREDICTED: supervillin isoform X3 [Tribolium castaneum]
MANADSVEELLKKTPKEPDFVIDGIHFGRGGSYYDENTSTHLRHKTTEVKCWRIVGEKLEAIESKNEFFSSETYIVRWKSNTEYLRFEEVLSTRDNEIYFYWKGEDAPKGHSPLPECIEKDNPPVERIVQWAEPPAFLQLFSGKFVVHIGKHSLLSKAPHLYILRGELEEELHLYELPLKRGNLRSRTSFVVFNPDEKSSIIWHGKNSNAHCKESIRKATEKIFGPKYTEITEGSENDKLIYLVENEDCFNAPLKLIDYTPRLFYFNKITGSFLTTEIDCSHNSSHITPFPFLQSHLYTPEQPAIFLLDDNDEIWIWYGWDQDEDDGFKTECFIMAINYAKQKSKNIKRLVKLQKVIAGFEPDSFTHLFPVWQKRQDIAQLQEKVGIEDSAFSFCCWCVAKCKSFD